MDDRNWLSKCIFIFCTIVNIQNAASFPQVPNSQEDYLMSVVSAPKGRKHAPSAPLMDDRYPGYYTPMPPKIPDRSQHGKPGAHRPIGFTFRTTEGLHEKTRKGNRKLHSAKQSRTKKPRPTWPNLVKKGTTVSTVKHESDPHIEHTTPLAIPHAGGGGYPDQTGMYQQQGVGGAYNQMGQSGQPNTGTGLLQSILNGNSGNCAPGGYCPQGGSNPFGGFGGGFGNNGFGGGFGNNGFGGGFGNNGFGGGFGNNGLGGGLGNLFGQGSTTTQSTTTSTTKDPLDFSFNLSSNDNSSNLSSFGSFGDYGLSNATLTSDSGLSLDDSSNSTSTTDGNSTSTTNSNGTSTTNSYSTSTTNSDSTSSVDGSGKVSATDSSNGASNSSNSSTISTSSSDPKDKTTSTTVSLGLDSFNYNYDSGDSSSSFENTDFSNDYESSGLSNAYEDKDSSIDYEEKDLGNDNANRK